MAREIKTVAKLNSTLEATKEEFKFHKTRSMPLNKIQICSETMEIKEQTVTVLMRDQINRIIGITEKFIHNREETCI